MMLYMLDSQAFEKIAGLAYGISKKPKDKPTVDVAEESKEGGCGC